MSNGNGKDDHSSLSGIISITTSEPPAISNVEREARRVLAIGILDGSVDVYVFRPPFNFEEGDILAWDEPFSGMASKYGQPPFVVIRVVGDKVFLVRQHESCDFVFDHTLDNWRKATELDLSSMPHVEDCFDRRYFKKI